MIKLAIELGPGLHGGYFWRIKSVEEGVNFDVGDGFWTNEQMGHEKTMGKAIEEAARAYGFLVATDVKERLIRFFANEQVVLRLEP